jgi:DnaJ-domain-containing protein 1
MEHEEEEVHASERQVTSSVEDEPTESSHRHDQSEEEAEKDNNGQLESLR